MNRAAAWRMNTPAVRYDYAPRSWDMHHRSSIVDLARRENFWPLVRKTFKLAAISAVGAGIVYSGMSYRVHYLGDGTLRFEKRADLAMTMTATAPSPVLALMGVTGPEGAGATRQTGTPAPAPKASPVDAAPHAPKKSGEDECRRTRHALSAAIASYNKRYPGTRIRSFQTLALATSEFGEKPACAQGGAYSLSFKAEEPVVKCPAHS
ncbi:MAG: hypothetical protein HY303_15750 [Candidatus Wallbacteria bacterium]|nr:hypothetical protein [Candidatus Wallbacteria bacterium]